MALSETVGANPLVDHVFFLKWSCYGVYPTRIPENMAFMVHPMSTTSHCSFHGSTSNTSEYIPHLIACITDISYVNYVRTSPYAKSSIFFFGFSIVMKPFSGTPMTMDPPIYIVVIVGWSPGNRSRGALGISGSRCLWKHAGHSAPWQHFWKVVPGWVPLAAWNDHL